MLKRTNMLKRKNYGLSDRALYITLFFAGAVWGISLLAVYEYFRGEGDAPPPEPIVETVYLEKPAVDWDLFTEALILHESKGDDKAVGALGDSGCLQIMPIYVNDVNRILGYARYTLEDRFYRKKSIEMFNIIQNHYNPGKDPHLALKLHNPLAPVSYHEQVMAIYWILVGEREAAGMESAAAGN